MTRREIAIAAPLVALAILFGVYPRLLFDYIDAERAKDRRELRQSREAADERPTLKTVPARIRGAERQ